MTQAAETEAALPFSSLTELRSEHLSMLRMWRKTEGADANLIIAFRKRIAATGSVLDGEAERETAQDFLEYWSAQLLSAAGSEATPDLDLQLEDYSGTSSAPPEGSIADRKSDISTDKRDTQKTIEASEQLRLGALARQWRQSNRVPSYLLTGAALTRASSFRQNDPEIEAFVAASERRVRERKRRWLKRSILAGLAALAVAASLISIAFYQYYEANQAFTRACKRDTILELFIKADNITPDQKLLSYANQIDSCNPSTRDGAVERLTAALTGPGAQESDKTLIGTRDPRRITDQLVGMLMHPSVDGLTQTGLENLLQILSGIPQTTWGQPEWKDTLAGARKAAAGLLSNGLSLSSVGWGYFDKLKGNLGEGRPSP